MVREDFEVIRLQRMVNSLLLQRNGPHLNMAKCLRCLRCLQLAENGTTSRSSHPNYCGRSGVEYDSSTLDSR